MSRGIAVTPYKVLIITTLLLAACSTPLRQAGEQGSPATTETSKPASGGYLKGDGPGADTPVNLDAVPDAVPRIETLHQYANRPYSALGQKYTPLISVGNYKQRGIASWYGKKFHGQRTSVGEVYDMYAMTAAHPTLPIPSYARVTNLANQKSVVVRVNDRGPFLHDRVIDLSYTAAYKLDILANGSAEVEVESLSPAANTLTIVPNTVISQPLERSLPAVPVTAEVTATVDSLPNSGNVYLQLGAFESQENAKAYLEKIRSKLSNTDKQFKLSDKDGMVRVHMGPYGSQAEARGSADSLEEALGFKPMLILP